MAPSATSNCDLKHNKNNNNVKLKNLRRKCFLNFASSIEIIIHKYSTNLYTEHYIN